jgi:two-component system sensor histidine kinase/response regulator
LAISQRLVHLMGGRMWAQSQLQAGSVFHFTARFDVSTSTEPAGPPLDVTCLRGTRVLVVDDNQTNRRILEENLRTWGADPTLCSHSAAALVEMERAASVGMPYALLLLDNHMPEMDGMELAARLRDSGAFQTTSILMLTSADRPEDLTRSRELGFAAYLVKPVGRDDLLRAILVGLGAGQQRREQQTRVGNQVAHSGLQRRLCVLVVEDNLVNQKLAVRRLEKLGHQVTVAPNGKAALEHITQSTFDIVLMDIQMPVMDGIAATAALRERERLTGTHLPVVAMTAHAMPGDRENCLKAGMDGYVAKPLDGLELVREIESVLAATGGADTAESAVAAPTATAPGTVDAAPGAARGKAHLDRACALVRCDGDDGMLREVAAAFIPDLSNSLAQLDDARSKSNGIRFAEICHTLKGNLIFFGANDLASTAKQLELASRQHGTVGTDVEYGVFRAGLHELLAEMRSSFGGRG